MVEISIRFQGESEPQDTLIRFGADANTQRIDDAVAAIKEAASRVLAVATLPKADAGQGAPELEVQRRFRLEFRRGG
jgi:hypothetical protein